MVNMRAEVRRECGIEFIVYRNEENKLELWLKMCDIQDNLDVKNMSDLTIKEIEGIYNKKRSDITKQEKEKYKAKADDGCVHIIEMLAIKIKICRGVKKSKDEIERKQKKKKRKF